MKKDLIDILCCPTCKGQLLLDIVEQNKEEVIEGSFICKKCKNKYYIKEGIPNLLPK